LKSCVLKLDRRGGSGNAPAERKLGGALGWLVLWLISGPVAWMMLAGAISPIAFGQGGPANAYYQVVFQLSEAVANREIVDEVKFKSGLSKVIDGTVECLNASSWAHPR
jgi:hypothetical protein